VFELANSLFDVLEADRADLALRLSDDVRGPQPFEQIRVNAIHPTNVNTDMLHSPPMYRAFRPDLQNPTREDAEVVFPVIQGFPIPYVEPEDISEAVLFLASDAARYVTGQQLRVDAGGFLKIKAWAGV